MSIRTEITADLSPETAALMRQPVECADLKTALLALGIGVRFHARLLDLTAQPTYEATRALVGERLDSLGPYRFTGCAAAIAQFLMEQRADAMTRAA